MNSVLFSVTEFHSNSSIRHFCSCFHGGLEQFLTAAQSRREGHNRKLSANTYKKKQKKTKKKRKAYHGGQSVRYAPPQLKRIAVAASLVNLSKVIWNPLARMKKSVVTSSLPWIADFSHKLHVYIDKILNLYQSCAREFFLDQSFDDGTKHYYSTNNSQNQYNVT